MTLKAPKVLLTLLMSVTLYASTSDAADHAVILQYHHIASNTPYITSVSPELFEDHLRFIRDNGYTVLPLKDIVEKIQSKDAIPDRTVAITIDDAYSSVYYGAYPLLEKFGYPFTVFVSTRPIDHRLGGYMSWAQMRKMKLSGADFASHGNSHSHLLRKRRGETDRDWAARIRDDIRSSISRLEEELGPVPPLFAYPYGEYNEDIKAIVKDLGLVGLGQQSGAVGPLSDMLALPRYPMGGPYSAMKQFRVKIATLPLPVADAAPSDPVLPEDEDMPALRLTLDSGEYKIDSLRCFLGGNELPIKWIDKEKRVLEVRSTGPLPEGRSRYNCTARHKSENRYFWYSHMWINNVYHKQDGFKE